MKLSFPGTFAPESENDVETFAPQHELSVIYTDFEKAFDKVLHNTLVSKLGNPAVYGYKSVFLLLYIYALNSASDQCT